MPKIYVFNLHYVVHVKLFSVLFLQQEWDNNMEPSTSLIDAYNLKEKAEETASTSFNEKKAHNSKQSSKESQVVLLNESL